MWQASTCERREVEPAARSVDRLLASRLVETFHVQFLRQAPSGIHTSPRGHRRSEGSRRLFGDLNALYSSATRSWRRPKSTRTSPSPSSVRSTPPRTPPRSSGGARPFAWHPWPQRGPTSFSLTSMPKPVTSRSPRAKDGLRRRAATGVHFHDDAAAKGTCEERTTRP